MWLERLDAAEGDRKTLFTEAQRVESLVAAEKARKLDAQSSAAHYRELLQNQM